MSYVGVVVLTLMKGDEGVQASEERADQVLFGLLFGNDQLALKKVIRRNIKQAMVACTFGGNLLNLFVPTVSFVIGDKIFRGSTVQGETDIKR